MRPLLILLLLLAPAVVAAEAQHVPARDPRVVEANERLGDAAGWPRAIKLYRDVLGDDPANVEARLWLARVLSWKGDYDDALAEYDRLLAEPGTPPTAEIERAEVVSWAGRYDQAERAFVALLERDPEHARAARGLARVYGWSGRRIEADRAYRRALDLEEDSEARAEWLALYDGQSQHATLALDHFADDDDFARHAVRAEGAFAVDLATRLIGRVGWVSVEHDFAETLGLHGDDSAGELSLALERQLGEAWQGTLELGGRVWKNAGASPLARARLSYRFASSAVAALEVVHTDALEATDSLAAVEDDVRVTALGATLWKGYTPQWESFFSLRGRHYSDSNSGVYAGGSVAYRPWTGPDLRVHLALDSLFFSDDSPLYYAPEQDLNAKLRLTHSAVLPLGVEVSSSVAGGWGRAEESGVTGSGLAFDAGLALSREFDGGWRLSLEGSIAQSRRASLYRARHLTASLGRAF